MNNELEMPWNNLSWPNLKSSLGICLEGLGKSTRNVWHCIRGSVEIRFGNHLNISEKSCVVLFVRYNECRVIKYRVRKVFMS